MPTWLFALIVLLIGLGLAFKVDRMKTRPGSGPSEPRKRSERSKWLYYWFVGRFPSKAEDAADEDEAKREAEAQQEQAEREEERKRAGQGRKK
jgi:hypothetical protein